MPRSRLPATLPPPIRRQLDVAAAVARERIKEVHVRFALELVEHAREEIAPRRAIDIYARLHKLGEGEVQALGHEVFMAIGRRGLVAPAEPEAAPQETPWGTPESVLQQIRRRIRGRVNRELRDWVEHHTGRAQTALLWAHVENAGEFVDLLRDARSAAEAVALYAEVLGVPPARTEVVYYLVLDQRSSSAARPEPGPRPTTAPDRSRPRAAPARRWEPRRGPGRHPAG